MIKIIVYYNEKDLIGYVIEGHEPNSEPGQAIVCAAVSVLAQTSIMAISKILNDKHMTYLQSDGSLTLIVRLNTLTSIMSEKVTLILESFVLGLESIAEQYPDKVNLIYL